MPKPTKHARTNYRALAPFLETVNASDGHATFFADGYMPLSIENLFYTHSGHPVYGMMHYTTQNGDLMRDPDMTISVDAAAGTVEPLTFQNDFMGLYQEVYTGDGRYRPRLRTELDDFLWHWLQNLQEQGFGPKQTAGTDQAAESEIGTEFPSAPDGQFPFPFA